MIPKKVLLLSLVAADLVDKLEKTVNGPVSIADYSAIVYKISLLPIFIMKYVHLKFEILG